MPKDDADHPPPESEPTSADAFAVVGHELRAEILRVLGTPGGEGELSFSELRERVDADVEPSQLHYHLQQLDGHFIERTDDGYRLRAAGIRLTLALYAGTFDRRREHPPVDAGLDCHYCQGPVEATFDPIGVKIACPDCERIYDWVFLTVPLDAFKDETGAFSFSHFREYVALRNLFMARGICPSCANPLTPQMHTGEEHPGKVCIHQSCSLCGAVWTLSVGQALLGVPELIAFGYDHGVDIHSTPYWEFEFAETDIHVTVRSTDPWEVALEVTFDDDTLELVVDGDVNVVERNHLDAADDGSVSSPSSVQSGGTGSRKESDDAVVLPDNATCLRNLRRHRWPDGVTCPYCESGEITKDGTTSKDAQRYKCHDCNRSFNDLTGSVFAERGLSLPEMFHIVRVMDETETAQIARQLDRSYNSVLDFVHEVRDARATDSELDPSEIVPSHIM